MKSYIQKPHEVDRKWFVVDAKGETLGRLASKIATVLRGKHKPTYTPHVDCGDFVIVINADKVKFTGKKLDQKMYRWHTGYVGHLRERTARQMMETKPEKVVEMAIKGMLPKNRLGRQMGKKLRVYSGEVHEHQAQQPEMLKF